MNHPRTKPGLHFTSTTLNHAFRYFLPILSLVLFLGGAFAQSRHGLTPTDILRVAGVSDAQISPNGDWVVYAVATTDGDDNVSTLWLVRANIEIGANPPTSRLPEERRDRELRPRPQSIPLLPPRWSAATPRWSPDGRSIAFISTHDGQHGLWVTSFNPDRRAPRLIATIHESNFFITYAGESFAWSPDSRSIAFISAGGDTSAADPPADVKVEDPHVIDRIQYKSRTSLSDQWRTHVWLTEVENPEPRALTSGPFYDHALAFSPRGDEIAFVSNHEPDPDANNNSDIFAVDLHGQVRQITDTRGCEYEPAWSPDGKWIAYIATKRDVTTIDSVAEDTHVWVIDAAGGAGRDLSGSLDRRARSPHWLPDSRQVLFTAGDRGITTIFSVGIDDAKVKRLSIVEYEGRRAAVFELQDPLNAPGNGTGFSSRPYQIGNFSLGARPITLRTAPTFTVTSVLVPIAFTISDSLHPAEVWSGINVGYPVHRISFQNESLVQSTPLIDPEEIYFRSFDGTRIQAWLMKPLDWRDDRKYPLILSVHGGPHGMYGAAFNPAFQVYCARGYAVLYVNPRGSSGYGQKFSDGTINEWGGGDFRDLMAGVDEALRRYSWIDADHLAVTGGSYGGFMTNWIITQTTRFKAAVAAASVSNLISFYATSLYQDLIHAEFGGFPWDNYDLLWQWSPLRYARQVQTPTLFIHGEQDNDVHITQAEEMYMALKRRGVDTVLVRYPREGHGLREPKHRVDALERTLAWFDKYLK